VNTSPQFLNIYIGYMLVSEQSLRRPWWSRSVFMVSLPATSISGRQHLRSAATGTLLVPRTRTATGQRSFAVNGPAIWNHLSQC